MDRPPTLVIDAIFILAIIYATTTATSTLVADTTFAVEDLDDVIYETNFYLDSLS